MSKAIDNDIRKFVLVPQGLRPLEVVAITEMAGERAPYLDVEFRDVRGVPAGNDANGQPIVAHPTLHKNYPLWVYDRETGEQRANNYLVGLVEACGLSFADVVDVDWETDDRKVLYGLTVVGNVFHEPYRGVTYARVGNVMSVPNSAGALRTQTGSSDSAYQRAAEAVAEGQAQAIAAAQHAAMSEEAAS